MRGQILTEIPQSYNKEATFFGARHELFLGRSRN